jgi:hypothetical protein
MFSLDPSEVTMIMASVAPTSVTGSGVAGALAVQIDSPFNDPAVSREIVRRLVAIGFDVALVREVPGPPQELTEIRYVDSNVLADIGLKDFIGDFETAQTRERAQGIELSCDLWVGLDGLLGGGNNGLVLGHCRSASKSQQAKAK